MFWDDDVWVLTERAFASALDRDWCSATDHRPLTLSTVLYDLARVYFETSRPAPSFKP